MTYSTLNPLNSFELAFFDKYFVTSRKKKKKRNCKEWAKNRYLSDFVTT